MTGVEIKEVSKEGEDGYQSGKIIASHWNRQEKSEIIP
jgi:hypothetical protein